MKRRRLVWASLAALGLAGGSFSLGCVDGVTPNCADAAACAPTEGELPDAHADTGPNDAAPETGNPIPTGDASSDASSDAPSDGG
jgi:hypothetical protein